MNNEALKIVRDNIKMGYVLTFADAMLIQQTIDFAMQAEPVTAATVPELTNAQCLEFLTVAFRHATISGDIEFDDIRLGLKMALSAAPEQEV